MAEMSFDAYSTNERVEDREDESELSICLEPDREERIKLALNAWKYISNFARGPGPS